MLRKLASGHVPENGARSAAKTDPNRILAELEKMDLIRKNSAGAYKMTDTGRAFLKRALCENDADDRYCAQHRTIREREGDQKIIVNLSESPLSRLYHRRGRNGARLIEEYQFLAGERLRRDFEIAQLSPKLGLTLAPKVDGGQIAGRTSSDALEGAIAARTRIDHALHFVGRETSSLLLDVCCFLKGLECVERERQWPVRSAKIVLGLALTRLATHYGLSNEATAKNTLVKHKSHVWHADER